MSPAAGSKFDLCSFCVKQKKTVFREVCTWQSGKQATVVAFSQLRRHPQEMRTAGIQGTLEVLGPQDDEDAGMQGSLEVLLFQGDEKLLNPARVA